MILSTKWGEGWRQEQALKKGSKNLKDLIFKVDSKNAIEVLKPNYVGQKKFAEVLISLLHTKTAILTLFDLMNGRCNNFEVLKFHENSKIAIKILFILGEEGKTV